MTDERDSFPELEFDGPAPDTRNAIREAVAADLVAVVPRSMGTRLWHGLAAATIVAALTIASYGPTAFGKAFSRPTLALVGILIAAGSVMLASSAFFPKLKDVGRDTRVLVVVGAIAAYSLYWLSTITDPAWATALGAMAGGCAMRSLGAGVAAGAAFMWVWRKADPWTPRVSGALIGACAGVLASTCVGLVCAGGHGGHVLVGHWLSVPILAVCSRPELAAC